MNPVITQVTSRIEERSAAPRADYLARMTAAGQNGPARHTMSCSNIAHAIAASSEIEKSALKGHSAANIGIVTAYNDMLSAHQPFETYPAQIKRAAAEQVHDREGQP